MDGVTLAIFLVLAAILVGAIYAERRGRAQGAGGLLELQRLLEMRGDNALTEMVRKRPAECAAAINRFLDRIALPSADVDEALWRGPTVAALLFAPTPPSPASGAARSSSADSAATADVVSRLEEAHARLDAALASDGLDQSPQARLCVAQMTRLALEAPFREAFAKPDAYSGALWAKAVGTGGKGEPILACLATLDASFQLPRDFATLVEGLAATGRRLPITAAERASYALLNQG